MYPICTQGVHSAGARPVVLGIVGSGQPIVLAGVAVLEEGCPARALLRAEVYTEYIHVWPWSLELWLSWAGWPSPWVPLADASLL